MTDKGKAVEPYEVNVRRKKLFEAKDSPHVPLHEFSSDPF